MKYINICILIVVNDEGTATIDSHIEQKIVLKYLKQTKIISVKNSCVFFIMNIEGTDTP